MTVDSSVSMDCLYTSASCNRHQDAMDFGANVVLYASCNAVVVYDFEAVRVVRVLPFHKARVNTVKWIHKDSCFISSSDDKTAVIWYKTSEQFTFKPTYVLTEHSDSVLSGASCAIASDQSVDHNSGSNFLSCTSTSDQSLNFWHNETKICHMMLRFFVFDIQVVHQNSSFCPNCTAFFLAGSDCCVHLYIMIANRVVQPITRFEGHEDWVRSVNFLAVDEDSMLLASGSQDTYIRVWKISSCSGNPPEYCNKIFDADGMSYAAGLETVLLGHEDKVMAVRWIHKDGQPLRLVSASLDKAMVIWEKPAEATELWLERLRVGEVGGNSVGFLGCSFSADCRTIIGHSFNGALHAWSFDEQTKSWIPREVISGHFGPVKDLSWDPKGRYFLTCSLDETTRLHAPWQTNQSWHEISRPQIHGYEINCIAASHDWLFISGADEKVLRTFRATKCFVQSLKQVSNLEDEQGLEELSEFATVSALGLSNKAASGETREEDTVYRPIVLTKPPVEEVLLQNTLWPEVHKLYGHGYELFAVTVNHQATIIASASKAAKQEHASIILWDLKNNYKQLQQLSFHQLTVTQIRFSPDDKMILSVSRDRTWCLHKLNEEKNLFERFCCSDKRTCIHARIIWDCAWATNDYFLTVSRDKKIICWEITDECDHVYSLGFVKACSNGILSVDHAATSVDVSKNSRNGRFLSAIGLENGDLLLCRWSKLNGWQTVHHVNLWHHLSINRLRFSSAGQNQEKELLASCSDDGMVKLAEISVS